MLKARSNWRVASKTFRWDSSLGAFTSARGLGVRRRRAPRYRQTRARPLCRSLAGNAVSECTSWAWRRRKRLRAHGRAGVLRLHAHNAAWVCACVRACVHACMHACVRACALRACERFSLDGRAWQRQDRRKLDQRRSCTVVFFFNISRCIPTANAEDLCRFEGTSRRVSPRPFWRHPAM